MAVTIIHFIIGLLLLMKGGDWFVDGAVGVSKKLHIPELITGATIVSIGTTLPEVMVSATGALSGSSAIAYGNAIGSVICNTSLILALSLAIAPTVCSPKSLRLPVLFFFAAAVLYAAVAYFGGYFSRLTGIILLCIFVLYMGITIWQAKKSPLPAASPAGEKEEPALQEPEMPTWKCVLLLIVGAGLIAVGANWLVHYGTKLAVIMGVPESVIALTFVALGTSLPELVTAVISLIKKHNNLSLGNIIGANLFNLVLVSGIAITLCPYHIPAEKTIAGINASLIVDIPLMFIVMLIACVPALTTGKLKRWQGISLLALYAGYVAFQFCF